MAMSGGDEPIAQRPKKRTPKKTVDQSVKSSESDTVVGDEPNVSTTSVEAPKKKPAPLAKVPDYLAPTDVAKRKGKPVNPFAVAPVDEQPPAKFDPTPERNQPPKTVEPPPKADPAPVATTPALAKVPTDDVLKKADVEIREVFDFKAATDLESRKKLVAEIRSTALETKTDPVGQYAMLRTARDLSAHLGDYAAAEQTINEMSERFDIDPLAMRSKAIIRAMTAKVSAEQRGKVARAGLALAKEFHKADRYKEALATITAVGRAASRVKDKQLVADARQLAIESRAMAKQHVSVQRAMETLETTPDDPAANMSVGKYLCFAKGDWKRGLAMLTKGDDAKLMGLAAQELDGTDDAKEQVTLADSWWKIGKEKSNQSYSEILPHAGSLYRRALPQLTGLAKAKVEKRLALFASPPKVPVFIYLDDIQEAKSSVGVGRLGKHGHSGIGNVGAATEIRGQRYNHMLSAHPPSRGSSFILYNLDGSFQTLRAKAAILDFCSSTSPLTFVVHGDGKRLWQSRPLRTKGDLQEFSVQIRRVRQLVLEIRCPGKKDGGVGVWAEPSVEKNTNAARQKSGLKMKAETN
jgi:hypothetical protein